MGEEGGGEGGGRVGGRARASAGWGAAGVGVAAVAGGDEAHGGAARGWGGGVVRAVTARADDVAGAGGTHAAAAVATALLVERLGHRPCRPSHLCCPSAVRRMVCLAVARRPTVAAVTEPVVTVAPALERAEAAVRALPLWLWRPGGRPRACWHRLCRGATGCEQSQGGRGVGTQSWSALSRRAGRGLCSAQTHR